MQLVAVAFLSLAAAYSSMRLQRIPNVLTLGASVIGLILGSFHGFQGLTDAVMGWLAGAALLIPLALVGTAGPGDLKLAAAIGVLGGWKAAGQVGLCSLAVLTAVLLIRVVAGRSLGGLTRWAWGAVGLFRVGGDWRTHVTAPSRGRIPLAEILAGGALLYVVKSLING